jgi:PAS domain S-box-containing protein
MKEIVCVKLENEMDLILAHKRSMKLCELMGFSLITQTSIATAVSEIARYAIEFGKNAELKLGVDLSAGKKVLLAVIRDHRDFTGKSMEAVQYAKRLLDDIEVVKSTKETQVILKQHLKLSHPMSDLKLESYVKYFEMEPPLSPYDEIRKKNILLFELAEQLKESENDFRVLTDSLPLMMFSLDNKGGITYTNRWLRDFFGAIPKELNNNSWRNFLHPADYSSFAKDVTSALTKQVGLNGQYRFREKRSDNFLWHIFFMIPLKNEKEVITRWIGSLVDINAQKQIEQTLKDNRELKLMQEQLYENQRELQAKVIELNRSNYELEQFAHLASHDLQEPLRKLFFYSDVLKRRYFDKVDDAGLSMLNSMGLAAARMKELINDLLSYSQLHKQQLTFEAVNLEMVVHEIIKDLDMTIREKKATFSINKLPVVHGNTVRLRQLFTNLISNALKYSKIETPPYIEILASRNDSHVSIIVKDNGIGFEDEYKEKIFGLFERLHTKDQFPGTGIGLSICKRIAELHNGSISAQSEPGAYAIFEVILPVPSN